MFGSIDPGFAPLSYDPGSVNGLRVGILPDFSFGSTSGIDNVLVQLGSLVIDLGNR